MTNPLDWTHPTAAIPATGLDAHRKASAAEGAAVAAAADILGVERLEARYRITQAARGRYLLEGKIRARVVQACVVTLDPVTAELAEPFSVEFWPAEAPERKAKAASALAPEPKSKAAPAPAPEWKSKAAPAPGAVVEREVFGDDEPERIENNAIDAGRIVFETLVTALDPYPRAPGAELELPGDASGAGSDDAKPDHPFAALAKLKPPRD